MKKITLSLLLILLVSTITAQVTMTPDPFEVSGSVTITVDINSSASDCNGFSNPSKVYIHSGIGPETNPWTYVIGNWGQDDGVGEMSSNGDGTYSITFIPQTYYGLTAQQTATVTRMGIVFRNETGSQEFKNNGCTDFFFDVGAFQSTLSTPDNFSTTILNSGQSLNISATNTNGNADYVLNSNGTILNTSNNTSSYSYTHTKHGSNKHPEKGGWTTKMDSQSNTGNISGTNRTR